MIKNFIPYRISRDTCTQALSMLAGPPAHRDLAKLASADPDSSQWSSAGLVEPSPGYPLVQDFGFRGYRGIYFVWQFNERILPAVTVKERMLERVAKLQEADGRKLTRTEYAQIRDSAIAELLPQAFIRRTLVPVMMVMPFSCSVTDPARLLIGTASAKRGDDAFGLTCRLLQEVALIESVDASLIRVHAHAGDTLTSLAGGNGFESDDGDAMLESDGTMALEHAPTGAKARLSDAELADVQDLIETGYKVTQLAVNLVDNTGGNTIAFKVDTKRVFRGLKILDLAKSREDDFDADLILYGDACARALSAVLEAMGGELIPEPAEPQVATQDDEDEL